jgi:hypothetical protein
MRPSAKAGLCKTDCVAFKLVEFGAGSLWGGQRCYASSGGSTQHIIRMRNRTITSGRWRTTVRWVWDRTRVGRSSRNPPHQRTIPFNPAHSRNPGAIPLPSTAWNSGERPSPFHAWLTTSSVTSFKTNSKRAGCCCLVSRLGHVSLVVSPNRILDCFNLTKTSRIHWNLLYITWI